MKILHNMIFSRREKFTSDPPLRVLHCPTSTGGHPQGLSISERKQGIDSVSIQLCSNYISYPVDKTLFDKEASEWVRQVLRLSLLFSAFRHHDVIHYNSGETILPWSFSEKWAKKWSTKWVLLSLVTRFFRRLEKFVLGGKVIVVTFQGDDARQGSYCMDNYDISIAHNVEGYYTADSDKRVRKRVQDFESYADIIYALNPDLLNVLPRRTKFIPYAHVDSHEWTCGDSGNNKLPTLIHAPSHRGAKGTKYIIEAVDKLRAEGINFEFILVEGLSNAEARKIYETADLIIDQLLVGWYGGLAVEAMALGKPVICYLREADLRYLPEKMIDDIPIIRADPTNITDVLREWLTTRIKDLPEYGNRGRSYVEKWHDQNAISKRIVADYKKAWVGKASFL